MTSPHDGLPVVDLSRWSGADAERRALADEVRAICHDVGFFLLVGHGVDGAFIDRVFATMARLFALPDEVKASIAKEHSPHFRGWEAVGTEHTNGRPDIREQVDLWSEHPARHGLGPADADHLRLLGPNQWFDDDTLPGSRALVAEWFDRMGGVATTLMEVLAVGLGLAADHFERIFGTERMSLTKLIHYPPTPAGAAGVNAHHDAGFLTVLAPGPTPGLEVQWPDGTWVPVQHVPGAFVINLGEMLQGMSGNYYVATPHRVVTAGERYSAGYFHGPSLDTPLVPLELAPEFADAVAASPRHTAAGYMARREETEAGVGDMASDHRPATYGEQLWNYFSRSYPDIVARWAPEAANSSGGD